MNHFEIKQNFKLVGVNAAVLVNNTILRVKYTSEIISKYLWCLQVQVVHQLNSVIKILNTQNIRNPENWL
jgi:hypothetical protein